MIAPLNPEPEQKPPVDASGKGQGLDQSGGQGAILTDPHHFRADARMLEMAARRRWPVRKKTRREAVERLEQAIGSHDDDTAIAAVRVLGFLDGLNIKREQGPSGNANNVNVVNVGVSVADGVEGLLNEPDYLAYLESRKSGDPGIVRGNSHNGEVPHSATHNGHVNGHNGHANGQNGTVSRD